MQQSVDHYVTMTRVIEYLTANASASMDEIARSMGMSTDHLRKVFTAWVGISPKQFARYLTLGYAKELLHSHSTMITTSTRAGLSSGGRLHDLFVDIEAMTPGEYQAHGADLVITYSTFPTPFGICLVASTPRGVCNVLFADTPDAAMSDLSGRWPHAMLIHAGAMLHKPVKEYFSGINPRSAIKLHLRGTNFQIKVWEALLSIPEGAVSSYGKIANSLGDKGLSRAVGTAIGENPVGYLIPCHRVLKCTGEIGGYRWGVLRKRAMLGYEAAHKKSHPEG